MDDQIAGAEHKYVLKEKTQNTKYKKQNSKYNIQNIKYKIQNTAAAAVSTCEHKYVMRKSLLAGGTDSHGAT